MFKHFQRTCAIFEKFSVVALLAVVPGCGDIDGPTQGHFVGDWKVVSLDGQPLPAVVLSSSGAIHTLFSDLILSVPETGLSSFGYDVSDLSPVDNSVTVHVTCAGPVQISSSSDTLTLHVSTLEVNKCPNAAVEGERFVRSGDELIYNWNGHVARLKAAK